MTRIFIAGGYGLVGSALARHLRRIHQDVDLVVAGRNPEKGEALARELGRTRTTRLDLEDPATFAGIAGSDLVVAALYDPANALLEAAIQHGAAHIGITTTADNVAPVAFAAMAKPLRRPVVLLGYCAAGVATIVARKAAERFARVDSIAGTALFDTRDAVGPMTAEDAEYLIRHAPVREGGKWTWTEGPQHPRRIQLSDAQAVEGYPTGLLDVPGLAALTDAPNVRFDIAQGDSQGTLDGGAPSSDSYVDIEGMLASGRSATCRTVVSDPKGLMHLTALGVLVAAERVLGLDGQPAVAPGVFLPETMIAPEAAIARFKEFGVRISTSVEER